MLDRIWHRTYRICHTCDTFGRIWHTFQPNMKHKMCHIRLDLVFLCLLKTYLSLTQIAHKNENVNVYVTCVFLPTIFVFERNLLLTCTCCNVWYQVRNMCRSFLKYVDHMLFMVVYQCRPSTNPRSRRIFAPIFLTIQAVIKFIFIMYY